MKKKQINFSTILFLLPLLTSCKILMNEEKLIDVSEDDFQENLNPKKEQIEIKFSCGEDGISKYLDEGWIILREYSEEKICTWKSFPAKKNCDMEKDKGCKITKPDKIGEEKIYLLER